MTEYDKYIENLKRKSQAYWGDPERSKRHREKLKRGMKERWKRLKGEK